MIEPSDTKILIRGKECLQMVTMILMNLSLYLSKLAFITWKICIIRDRKESKASKGRSHSRQAYTDTNRNKWRISPIPISYVGLDEYRYFLVSYAFMLLGWLESLIGVSTLINV